MSVLNLYSLNIHMNAINCIFANEFAKKRVICQYPPRPTIVDDIATLLSVSKNKKQTQSIIINVFIQVG